MKKQFVRHNVLPVIAAFIWGMAFVAQSKCSDKISPMTFTALRSIIAACFLAVVYAISRKTKKKMYADGFKKTDVKTAVTGGVLCGVFLCAATNIQQLGIMYTTVAKAGFITTLYIIFVPVFGIFLKKKCPVNVWISVAIAVIGLYFLSITEEFTLAKGDAIVVLCAVLFSLHILVIDRFSDSVDGILLSLIQFITVSVLSAIGAVLFETIEISAIMSCMLPILYVGIFSSGVAYTLQIIATKGANPTVLSLLLSLESVFAAVGGYAVLGQKLTSREVIGCCLMFSAAVLAQIKFTKKEK